MLQYALHVHYRISKRIFMYTYGKAQPKARPQGLLQGIKTIVHILIKKTFPVITDA
jgi:hypothetical protein